MEEAPKAKTLNDYICEIESIKQQILVMGGNDSEASHIEQIVGNIKTIEEAEAALKTLKSILENKSSDYR
jgi:hypothetical protein